MQLKKTVVAAVLGLSFTGFAQAVPVEDLGEIKSGDTVFGSHMVLPGTFFDEYTFTVASDLLGNAQLWSFDFGPGNGQGNPNNMLALTDLTVYLYKGDLSGELIFEQQGTLQQSPFGNNSLTVTGSFVLDPSMPDSYTLVIAGTAVGSQGGAYNVSMSVTAVPEPAEYAMLLAGLGVVGMIARRRKMKIN